MAKPKLRMLGRWLDVEIVFNLPRNKFNKKEAMEIAEEISHILINHNKLCDKKGQILSFCNPYLEGDKIRILSYKTPDKLFSMCFEYRGELTWTREMWRLIFTPIQKKGQKGYLFEELEHDLPILVDANEKILELYGFRKRGHPVMNPIIVNNKPCLTWIYENIKITYSIENRLISMEIYKKEDEKVLGGNVYEIVKIIKRDKPKFKWSAKEKKKWLQLVEKTIETEKKRKKAKKRKKK